LIAPTSDLGPLLQESPSQLLKALITILGGLASDRLDMCAQRRVAPVIARGLFRVTGHPSARGFQQRLRRGGIESGVVARRQVELAPGATRFVAIIVNERA